MTTCRELKESPESVVLHALGDQATTIGWRNYFSASEGSDADIACKAAVFRGWMYHGRSLSDRTGQNLYHVTEKGLNWALNHTGKPRSDSFQLLGM